MATKTDVLDDVNIEIQDDDEPIDAIVHRLGASLGWPALDELRKCKLEGFEGPFVRVLVAGKLLWGDTNPQPLRVGDVPRGKPLVVVLQRLVAEGWRLRTPDAIDLWSDTDEEEGGWDAVPAPLPRE